MAEEKTVEKIPNEGIGYLSHAGGFSSFRYGEDVIRFATSKALKHYIRVKKWECGYLEVDADYGKGEEEDYIDLLPILDNLYYDAQEFLRPIRKVEVRYV